MVFAGIGLFLAITANVGCGTFQFTSDKGERLYAGLGSYRTSVAVEWNGNIYIRSVCAQYDYLEDEWDWDVNLDDKAKNARIFGLTSAVLGTICLILVCLVPCFHVSPKLWKVGGLFMWIICILQGLTLTALDSDICLDNPALGFANYLKDEVFPNFDIIGEFPEECSWAAGFRMSISSVVFWFLAGLCMLVLPAPGSDPLITNSDDGSPPAASPDEPAADEDDEKAKTEDDKEDK